MFFSAGINIKFPTSIMVIVFPMVSQAGDTNVLNRSNTTLAVKLKPISDI